MGFRYAQKNLYYIEVFLLITLTTTILNIFISIIILNNIQLPNASSTTTTTISLKESRSVFVSNHSYLPDKQKRSL
jgi:hypothetical protein